ncbi:MAG: cation transporter [Acidimicrobiia bacterium]|nr:cation transporter [Acidimicrobiia bacterium]
MSTEASTRAIVAAMLANLGIAVAKFAGFLVTRSSSLLAESVHSVADTGNQVLLLFGGRRSRRPATRLHQFGHGRERFFWAFVVAIILFSLGALFAIYEGIEKVLHPHPIDSAPWAIGILAVSILLEANSFRTAVRESRPLKGEATWWGFIRRSRNPELPVVLLEDIGALVGLVLALIAITVAVVTGNGVFDGVGSIVIGVLLGVIAAVLAVEMKSLLIGESATPEAEARIAAAVSGSPRVDTVISLRTQHLGPEEVLVAAKVQFDADLTMAELADVIDLVEARVRGAEPTATRILIDPVVVRHDRPPVDGPWAGLPEAGD